MGRFYEMEVWSNSGVYLADIAHLAKNRKYTITRNDAETLEFNLDADKLAAFAKKIGEHPRNLLLPYQMNVRVKRDGQPMFGVQIDESPPTLDKSRSIDVFGSGYLNLLKQRTVTDTF